MGKGTKAKARHGTSRLQRSTPSRLLKALCPPHLPSSCQVSRLSFPHSLSRILLHLCSRQISQIFSHLRSRLSIKSPRVQLFQVASSPYRHSLFFVCLVFRCASVSPRSPVRFFDNINAKMKSVVIALCTFVAATAAQGSPNLAACGQTCATNMLDADKAEELGCKQNDLKCLCANKNFLYGLRDCSAAICSAEDAKKVVEYGISICASAGVAIQTKSEGGNGGATNTGSASGVVITGESTIATASSSGPASGKVSTILSTLTSDGKTITTGIATTIASNLSGGSASSDTDASGQVSTVATTATESDGSIETKTSQITLSGSATATGTAAHQTDSVILSTVTSDGSAIIETLTTLHKTTSESDTAVATETVTKPESSSGSDSDATATDTGSSSASTTSTSKGAGVPQKTAGPVGIIAAAGLAMLML
ncbi:hypothetical protein ACSS6W_001703 [Trichoderma asperelloides]|nr:hypothetical protein LI328DRAFT_126965 [Trichoderma asperelloides]